MLHLPVPKPAPHVPGVLHHWEHQVLSYFPNILSAILILSIFWLLAVFSRWLSTRAEKRWHHPSLRIGRIFGWIIYGFFIISGLFLALDVLDLTGFLTHMLAGAGIVGIVAGFALKDVASNLFAGMLVKIQNPFLPHDWVNVNNSFGQVKQIGWITTSIYTITGQTVYVPNQLIYSNNFTNYSSSHKWRIVVKCGVSYGDDLSHVERIALEAIEKLPCRLQSDPVDFYFTDIGNSTYNFEIRFWIKFTQHVQYLKACSEAIKVLKKRFAEEDICVAYNVVTLDFGVKGGVNLYDNPVDVNLQSSSINTAKNEELFKSKSE